MKPPETLATTRLVLRKPCLEDAPRIFSEYAQDRDVTRFLLWRPHRSIEDTKLFLNRCVRNWRGNHEFTWIITLKDSRDLIGSIALWREPTGAVVGYTLSKRFWGRGYMSEAVTVVTEWAINQQDIFRVWAVCDTENTASSRVLEKAGMQREGILRRWTVLPNIGNEPRDCYCYAKVR